MLECSVKIFGNLTGIFFFLLCIEGEDEHLEIVQVVTECWCQKVLSAGCGYFQEWPHAPGTPQKIWSIWSRVTHVMPEARGCWMVSTVMGADSKWVTHCRVVWAAPGGSYIEEATRNTSRRWNVGAAGGVCYGRKYWGKYLCATSQTSVLRKPLPRIGNSVTGDSRVLILLHKIFLKVDLQR